MEPSTKDCPGAVKAAVLLPYMAHQCVMALDQKVCFDCIPRNVNLELPKCIALRFILVAATSLDTLFARFPVCSILVLRSYEAF